MCDLNSDIEKYLKGELDARAMQRLEKQALTDPFLAEALEGAETIDPEGFSEDVNELGLKIRGKTKKHSFVWPLRIAASLALIAIISLVTYTWEYPSKENLALSKEPAATVPQKQAEAVQKDGKKTHETIDGKTNTDADGEIATSNPGTGLPAEKPTLTKEQTGGAAEESRAEIMETPTALDATISPLEESDDLATSENKNTRQPVELLLDVAPAEAKKIATETLKERRGAALRSTAPGDNSPVKPGEAQPHGGYESLQSYLQQHIQYPKEALDNRTEGLVSILFIVKETGELTDFTVTQAIGNGCEEALIASIKSISWIPARDENGKPVADSVAVNYQFNLPR